MKRSNNIRIGKSGVIFVESITNKYNDIFQKIDGDNDIGFDGYIEIVEGENSYNFTVACQIKSGKSYFKNDKAYIQTDEDHIKYWKDHNLYSFLFVYNENDDKCYWLDLTKYVNSLEEDKYNIIFNLDNELNSNTYLGFKEYVKQIKFTTLNDSKLMLSLNRLIYISQKEVSYDKDLIISIMNNRNNILVWNTVINCFLYSTSDEFLINLIYTMRLHTSNPDIFWHNDNVIEEYISSNFINIINSSIKEIFLKKLIYCCSFEDVLFERGQIGQVIYHIIELINDRDILLKNIIKSRNEEDKIREWSFKIFMYYRQEDFIFENLHLLEILNSDNIIVGQEYHDLKWALNEFGCFIF